MQDSPALALRLIREANQQAQSSLSEPAESLEVAINRLGLKRTQMLLEHVPALAIEDIPLAYRQIQLISQHAAQQAIGLFGNRLARLWQEIYWSSLLFLSPLWALALTHPLLLERHGVDPRHLEFGLRQRNAGGGQQRSQRQGGGQQLAGEDTADGHGGPFKPNIQYPTFKIQYPSKQPPDEGVGSPIQS